MTQSSGSTGRVVAAGLALALGYGAAAYAATSHAQSGSMRAPAVFGKIAPAAVAPFQRAAPMRADASSSLAAQLPRLPATRGPLRSGALRDFAAHGDVQLASLAWAPVPAVPRPLSLLTVSVGEQSWNLEQDLSKRERWLHQPDPDRLRGWS